MGKNPGLPTRRSLFHHYCTGASLCAALTFERWTSPSSSSPPTPRILRVFSLLTRSVWLCFFISGGGCLAAMAMAHPALGCQVPQGGCRKRLRCHMKSQRCLGKVKQPPLQNLSVRPADGSSSSWGREPWQRGQPQLQVAHLRMILLSVRSVLGGKEEIRSRVALAWTFSYKCF